MHKNYYNPFEPTPDLSLQPHRGRLVLLLGILGFFTVGIFGGLAWHYGNLDLRKMNMGVMDSSGVDLTEYGRILGIISVCMWISGLLVLAFWLATRIPAV